MTPSTAIQRPDLGLALEEFDLAMSRMGFIGQKVFPVLDVQLVTANFSRVTLQNLLRANIDLGRAPRAKYPRGNGQFTQDNYACKEYGYEEEVDDNESRMYAYTIDSEMIASQVAQDTLLRAYEKRVAVKLTDPAVFTGNYTIPCNLSWKQYSSATPVKDGKNAIVQIYDNFGIRPNVAVIPWVDFMNLTECSDIIDRIKYSGRDDPKSVTPQMIAALWDIEQVLVPDAVQNMGKDGDATATLSPVWAGGTGGFYKVAKTRNLKEPCIGRTFNWTGDGGSITGAVEEYREEASRGNVYRVRHQTDEKLLNVQMGCLLTGIAA